MARKKGSLSAALLKRGKPRHVLYLKGQRTNTIAKGPGSQRRGQGYRVGYDPSKHRFFHDYGQGRPTVYIRRANNLHAQYRSQFGLSKLLQANRSYRKAVGSEPGLHKRPSGGSPGSERVVNVPVPPRVPGPNSPRRRRRF